MRWGKDYWEMSEEKGDEKYFCRNKYIYNVAKPQTKWYIKINLTCGSSSPKPNYCGTTLMGNRAWEWWVLEGLPIWVSFWEHRKTRNKSMCSWYYKNLKFPPKGSFENWLLSFFTSRGLISNPCVICWMSQRRVRNLYWTQNQRQMVRVFLDLASFPTLLISSSTPPLFNIDSSRNQVLQVILQASR